MSDALATITAFSVGLGMMFGYTIWVAIELRYEHARQRAAQLASRASERDAVATEIKPRGTVRVS